MKTIAELRGEFELKTGNPVRYYRAYPTIGRGTVVHDWISHGEVLRRFKRACSISILKKLSWLTGGALWN